jgi:hypothetical protein
MTDFNEKLKRLQEIEILIPKLNETKKNLNELSDLLERKKKKLQDIIHPSDKRGGLFKGLFKKTFGKAVKAGLEMISVNKALKQTKEYQVKIDDDINDIQLGLKGLKAKLKNSIKGTNKKFSESVDKTQLKIRYLQNLNSVMEESEEKIITKKRQNVLSKDERRYYIVLFFTLIAINITLFIYMVHLIHYQPK